MSDVKERNSSQVFDKAVVLPFLSITGYKDNSNEKFQKWFSSILITEIRG